MPYNIYPWYLESPDVPQHNRTKDRDQTLAWVGCDTADLYKKNLQNDRPYYQFFCEGQ